jgi:hypothetical protein
MKHNKCEYPIKVFLSSSMCDEIFLERRKAIISFFERWNIYDLDYCEKHARPRGIKTTYIEGVRACDLMILIIEKTRREGIVEEFKEAKDKGKRVFAYILGPENNKPDELKSFIKEVRDYGTTTKTFNDTKELINCIEDDLLEDLLDIYKRFPDYEKNYKEELKKYKEKPDEEAERTYKEKNNY